MIIKRVGNLIRSGGEFVYYNNCYNILINVAKAVGKNIRDKIYSNIRNPLDHCKNNNKEHGTHVHMVTSLCNDMCYTTCVASYSHNNYIIDLISIISAPHFHNN